MKKQITLLLLLLPFMASGYNWTLFSPSSITANDICFNIGSQGYSIICISNGICENDGPGYTWNTYLNGGLPVWEAVPFNDSSILVVMGNGSFSDGIYKFNLVTHQYTVMEWLAFPTFIKYCTTNNTYYAGSQFYGLMSSTNGITWTAVPYFNSKGCTSMDYNNDHMVISQNNNIHAVYYSSDTGITWNQSLFPDPISYLAFQWNGKLYGIYPGLSNSAGLYKSDDFGQTWYPCYYSFDMNTLGFDATNTLLIGWRSTGGLEEGLAKYDTALSCMNFYNTGLPNKNINRIRVNPILSSIAIYVCTDNGVYFSNDYWTGIPQCTKKDDPLHLANFPNPCDKLTNIEFELPENSGNSARLTIFDHSGKLIKERIFEVNKNSKNRIIFDASDLACGLYYYRLTTGRYAETKKMIVAK
jgi:hypothetical protein